MIILIVLISSPYQERPQPQAGSLLDRSHKAKQLRPSRQIREPENGCVHVGAGPAALLGLLSPVLLKLREEHPNIEIIVTIGKTNTISQALLASEIERDRTALPVNPMDLKAVPMTLMARIGLGDDV